MHHNYNLLNIIKRIKLRYTILILSLLLAGSVTGQTCPTIGQIYDYAVGDTFETTIRDIYNGIGGISGINLTIITGRQNFSDSIVYTNHKWSTTQNGTMVTETTSPLIIYNINASAAPGYVGTFCEVCDTITYSYSCNNCSVSANEDCSEGASSWSQTLTCGLGATNLQVYCDFSDDPGDAESETHQEQLNYYHKVNGETSGYFMSLPTTVPILNESAFKAELFPNPSGISSILQISELPVQQVYFKLFDAVGKIVNCKTISQTSTSVNLQGQTAGTYFWELEAGGEILKRGKLLIQ